MRAVFSEIAKYELDDAVSFYELVFSMIAPPKKKMIYLMIYFDFKSGASVTLSGSSRRAIG